MVRDDIKPNKDLGKLINVWGRVEQSMIYIKGGDDFSVQIFVYFKCHFHNQIRAVHKIFIFSRFLSAGFTLYGL